MFKTIKKNSRKTKNFHSSFLAALFIAVVFGMYFSLLLNQTSTSLWTTDTVKWVVYSVLTIIFVCVAYTLGMRLCFDLKDKQNFFDNFIVSILVMVLGTLLVIYHLALKNWIFWLVTLAIIFISFFVSNFIFIKFRPK